MDENLFPQGETLQTRHGTGYCTNAIFCQQAREDVIDVFLDNGRVEVDDMESAADVFDRADIWADSVEQEVKYLDGDKTVAAALYTDDEGVIATRDWVWIDDRETVVQAVQGYDTMTEFIGGFRDACGSYDASGGRTIDDMLTK
jgi:hypothetical protein